MFPAVVGAAAGGEVPQAMATREPVALGRAMGGTRHAGEEEEEGVRAPQALHLRGTPGEAEVEAVAAERRRRRRRRPRNPQSLPL